MAIWTFSKGKTDGVMIPLTAVGRLRLVFPAERILHKSLGFDRTERMPTRFYETPTGQWATDDTNELRLLHNEFPFVIEKIAKVARDTEFVASSTNYGSNPGYCIRHPRSKAGPASLFYLQQETFDEPLSALSILASPNGLDVEAVRARFNPVDCSVTSPDGTKLPDEASVFCAPAIVWDGKFVTWERYARETYDCRHVVKIQYPYATAKPGSRRFEKARAEIQRIQRLWKNRPKYVKEVLRKARRVGYAIYERMIVGVGGSGSGRYLLLAATKGTAKSVAQQLIADYPDIDAAFQITEGGGTGILMGKVPDWRVLGTSSYRRGRVLCALLIEMADT